MDADVALLKNLFLTKIGSSWQSATRANTHGMLGITRGRVPWDEVKDVMMQSGSDTAPPAFVARHVRNLTSSFYFFSTP
eukprot:236359-Pleurochrysis_carterae.AAC.1